MTVIATSTTSLQYRVRLLHASTGAAIGALSVGPTLWPPGWSARVVSGSVVVARTATAGTPAPAFVDVTVADAGLAAHLVFPAGADRAHTIRVPLAGPPTEVPIDVALDPTPMVLTVALKDLGTGNPAVGKSVTVHPSTGADVPLTAVAGKPGVYSSAPRTWGAPFTPADLRIGATTVRKVSLDFTRAETRIHVVDPT
ncbi:hypothetical protein [Demequina sp.]|uniref:hypothetical protein n=1 Tax=Demequina sp. TaxID=2050685 RepID=UPI003D0B4F44